MKILQKGDVQDKATIANVETKVVECVHATVHTSLVPDERFQMTWNVFLGNLTEAQIMEAAAEHFIIKIRRTFAKIKNPSNDEWNNVTFDAKDYITSRTSKTEKLAATLATFTDEQLAALGLTRNCDES